MLHYNWTTAAIKDLFSLPFNDLIFQAHQQHRQNFDPNTIQLSTLLSIKTGGCSEDCSYCPQSARYNTAVDSEKMLDIKEVISAAQTAKDNGATRFCMGAAWRTPKGKAFERVLEMVREVKKLGLESCATLGMLNKEQARALKDAGLDYYNHNLDTSPEFYGNIITTRTYEDRLETLQHVRDEKMHVCCGGIVGMGESRQDRAELIKQLATMDPHPQSVPINMLIAVEGTPLQSADAFDPLEFVRTIAVARITMPTSYVRLSAGRENMSDELQALCYFCGANSIFSGEKLLTTSNPVPDSDHHLFTQLGLKTESLQH